MTFEKIRIELMEQHDEIRGVIKLIRCSESEILGTHLTRLRALLVTHNTREDELLGEVLPGIDAWGEIRALHMTQDHDGEQRSILRFVKELEDMDVSSVGELVERLLEHLDDEEMTYLNAKVLRDDIITIGHSGG